MNFYGEMYQLFDQRFVRNGHLVSDDPLPIKIFIDELLKSKDEMPPPAPVKPRVEIVERKVFVRQPCNLPHNCTLPHGNEKLSDAVIDAVSRLAPRAKHDMETPEAYSKRIQNFNAYREQVLKVLQNYRA